ncbi:MAG: EamA family transporter [Sedimentibacter sp.]|nr:EamA family transporter [Sedimentibacter sp.]
MKDLTSRQADLMLFFVAFFWGTGFTVTKIALDLFTTSQLLFIRFAVASAASLVIFNKNLRKTTVSDLKAGIVMGLFLALGYILQTFGLEGTTAGNSAFLTGTGVVMIPFFYWHSIAGQRPDYFVNFAASYKHNNIFHNDDG